MKIRVQIGRIFVLKGICLAATIFVPCQTAASIELKQTEKLLGVKVKEISPGQRISNFGEIDSKGEVLKFALEKRPLTGPTPPPSYEVRKFVRARAPNGTVYHGFSGRFNEGKVSRGAGETSSNRNTRQAYASHHGYGYNPSDVFIGRRVHGKIKTSLFFRDVGSHETYPYHFTVDSRGNVHLIVSDVNITDNNELNVYSVIGNPKTGKWIDAVMLDRRGFTSWSRPWSGSWGQTVHLLWSWGDATYDKENPSMGLFYVDWTPSGYGPKVRLIRGLVETYDAAVDPRTGELLIVAAVGNKVYLVSRTRDGIWRRPAELPPEIPTEYGVDVSVHPERAGRFVIRTSGEHSAERRVRIQ